MRTKRGSLIRGIALFVMLAMVVGCSLKGPRKHWWEFWKPKAPAVGSIYPVPPEVSPPPPVTDMTSPGEISSLPVDGIQTPGVRTMDGTGIPEPTPLRQEAMIEVAELPMIYFDFDSSDIRAQDIPLLDNAAVWLNSHPEVQVQIEGHCDERGTREYNLNLGQRRANIVKEYLVSKNVDPNRLHTISYGEERPIDPGQTEDAYAKNRRAQFFVY